MIYKEYKSACTFYPNIGIFFSDFALIYSITAAIKQKQAKPLKEKKTNIKKLFA